MEQNNENTALIKVTQLPIIEEHLKSLKEAVERETSEAMSLVCTEETIQTVKAKRAELNKKFNELEAQRKAVKAKVLEPWEHFEQVYKECVTDLFRNADNDLKSKILDTESEIKERCYLRLEGYFNELKTLNNVEWLRFEQANIKVDMASAKQATPKKLMEQIKQFVERIANDMNAISTMENSAEIASEYKKCLDYAFAVKIVNDRHKAIEEEQKAAEAVKTAQKRTDEVIAKVEAVTPPTVIKTPTEAEKPLKCVFTVYATKEQLINLKNYLEKEGIKYE